MEYNFKKINTDLKARLLESTSMREKYPDRVPVICEKNANCKLSEIQKSKLLIPMETTMAQIISIIRAKLKIGKTQALFILISGKYSISADKTINDIYFKYKDEDGFLYITYTNETVWG